MRPEFDARRQDPDNETATRKGQLLEVVIVNQEQVGALLPGVPLAACLPVPDGPAATLADEPPVAPCAVGDDHILGEISEVLVGGVAGRNSPADVTLFKSVGLAVEDLAAARRVYRNALQTGTGTTIEFGGRRRATH